MEADEEMLFKRINKNDESNLKSASTTNSANSNKKTFNKTEADKNFQKTFTTDTKTFADTITEYDNVDDADNVDYIEDDDDTTSDISLDELQGILESDTDTITDTSKSKGKSKSKGLLQQQQYGHITKDNEEVEIVKLPKIKELYVEDSEGIVPVKVAMGKRHLKVENSLLYSLMIFGSMSENECEEYKKICHSMNDHISYMIYQKALTGNKFYVKLLADLTKELLKRERTTLVQVQTERRSDDVTSILEQIENGTI